MNTPSLLGHKMHSMAKRHRSGDSHCMKWLHALGKGRLIIILAACAALLAAGAVSARAVDAPGVSAPALFNDGNAALRASRPGPAILDYERASLLAPGDSAIAQNLRAAREKADVASPAIPVWQRPAHWLSFNGMAGLASLSLFLFSLVFIGSQFIPIDIRGTVRAAAWSLGTTAVLAASAVAIRWPELNRAVIVGAHSDAYIAPAGDSTVLFNPKPGEVVTEENTYGDFVRIRTTDGRSGWVVGQDVEKIIPAAS
jgi:hypothetical protein